MARRRGASQKRLTGRRRGKWSIIKSRPRGPYFKSPLRRVTYLQINFLFPGTISFEHRDCRFARSRMMSRKHRIDSCSHWGERLNRMVISDFDARMGNDARQECLRRPYFFESEDVKLYCFVFMVLGEKLYRVVGRIVCNWKLRHFLEMEVKVQRRVK